MKRTLLALFFFFCSCFYALSSLAAWDVVEVKFRRHGVTEQLVIKWDTKTGATWKLTENWEWERFGEKEKEESCDVGATYPITRVEPLW